MPFALAVIVLSIATVLIALGIAMINNWRSWADRYAAWSRSNFGPFAFGGPAYSRFLGLIWIAAGIFMVIVWATSLASPNR